jgi:beta-galactosidase GanA
MIIYGAQYYRPPFPGKAAWQSDLLKMKQAHFNTVKLWAVWSWIERKEGEFYFEDLDELVELCAEAGLNVVINTIPEGTPYWFSRRHIDAQYQTNEGARVEMSGAANMPSGGTPGVCPDKAAVQAGVCAFISTVVERYAGYEHVTAFDVWNEPHLEPIFDYPEQLFCYCEHSKGRFIEWLQNKYGSLEALNQSWLRAYTDWAGVLPPVRYGTYPDMIDWRRFWVENLGVWLDARAQAARSVAQGKTVMTHVPFSGYIGGSGEGGLGYHLGDEFVLAPKVDKFGLTSFPKWLMQNDFVQHLINVELVATASAGKDFWQSELQAGAGKWEAVGRSVATPEEIRLWNWSAISGGAKGVMYWQWKPEPSGMEALGFGLTTLDGELSARTAAAAECSQAFNRPGGFDRAQRAAEVNGIFVSRTADLWWHAAFKGEPVYARSLYGAYRACFDAGIPVRMVHADRLHETEELKVLYVPAAVALSQAELDGLREFARSGGKLVLEACPGLFDERGVLREQGEFLQELLGLAGQEVDHHDVVRVQYSSGLAFTGRYYRQDFSSIEPGVNFLGCFEDGRPALFERSYGQGKVVLAGAFPAAAVGLNADPASAAFIARWMEPCGYARLRALQMAPDTLVRLHGFADQLYVSCVNYGCQEQTLQLVFTRDYRLGAPQLGVELDRSTLRVQLPARDGVLVWLKETG